MKRRIFVFLVLPLAGLFVVSCASPGPPPNAPSRFREAKFADVVLQYAGWQHVSITQPECREEGFLVDFSRDNLGPALERLSVEHDMAVVVLRWSHGREDVRQLIADWKDLLRSRGFRRIVCLQAEKSGQVQGLVILDDTAWPDDARSRTARL